MQSKDASTKGQTTRSAPVRAGSDTHKEATQCTCGMSNKQRFVEKDQSDRRGRRHGQQKKRMFWDRQATLKITKEGSIENM